jgi:hypothetical protein
MRAAIRRYECANSEDLSTYEMGALPVFSFTLTFFIGVEGEEGSDQFDVLVASAAYLAQRYPDQAATFLRHIMLAADYNIQEAVALMTKYVNSLEADSWQALASKINRVACWEYEDYLATS